MDKNEVAAVLGQIGILLELKGENPFKTRAYLTAVRVLESLEGSLEELVAAKRLGELKGFGEALQDKVTILVTTGRLPYYEELKASLPPGLPALLEIQGLGPKKVKRLFDELGVDSVETLEAACKENRIAGLEGFGEKSQSKILEAIAFKRQFASRDIPRRRAANRGEAVGRCGDPHDLGRLGLHHATVDGRREPTFRGSMGRQGGLPPHLVRRQRPRLRRSI